MTIARDRTLKTPTRPDCRLVLDPIERRHRTSRRDTGQGTGKAWRSTQADRGIPAAIVCRHRGPLGLRGGADLPNAETRRLLLAPLSCVGERTL